MSALLSDTSQSNGQAAGSMRTDGEKVYLYGRKTEEERLYILRLLSDNSLCPVCMEVMEPSLEKIFLEVTER